MKIIASFLFFWLANFSFSQMYFDYSNYYLEQNKKNANTAFNTDYLSNEEKKIFYYLNLVRSEPKLFLETFLSIDNQNLHQKKCTSSSKKKCPYIKSLINDLSNLEQLNYIKPNKEFFNYAYCHAKKSGKKGYIGHSRKKSGCTNLPSPYGECCHYGSEFALDIVLDLLIDCGVSNLGHREILLSNQYTMMGVSITTHKNYNYNAVLDLTY